MIFSIFTSRWSAVIIAALAVCSTHVFPTAAGAQRLTQLTHVPVSEVTKPPIGWIEFCKRQPKECAGATMKVRKFVITPERWNDLVHVNKIVNATIKPLNDLEHWGITERWSYPDDGYGDCEDYVLLKRRLLIQSGWPVEALLVTVVRDKKGKGHAVLTVSTHRGDYVLDNQNEHIMLWRETGYRFIKRQARSDPNIWVSLGNSLRVIATATPRSNMGR